MSETEFFLDAFVSRKQLKSKKLKGKYATAAFDFLVIMKNRTFNSASRKVWIFLEITQLQSILPVCFHCFISVISQKIHTFPEAELNVRFFMITKKSQSGACVFAFLLF